MTQRSVETVIGKLVADDDLRALFMQDPAAALEHLRRDGLELNAVERGALEATDVATFAVLARKLDPRLRKASLKPKRSRRSLGVAILVLAPAIGGFRPAAASALSLDEAVALALDANPGVASARLQLKKDDDAIAEARTRLYPSLSVDALVGATLTPVRMTIPGGALGDFPETGPIPAEGTELEGETGTSAYLSASVSQPLTQIHKTRIGTRLDRLARQVDEEKLRAERASVVRDVRATYYAILQTQAALAASIQRADASRETERVVGDQAEQEAVLPADRLQVKADVASANLRVVTLKNALGSSKERLNELLGRELATEFDAVPPGESPLDEPALEDARAHALANRPEVRQAHLAVEQAEAQRRFRRADLIPDLSLTVSYTTFSGIDLMPRNLTQAGLQLSWEPFDWGRRARRTAQAEVQIEQARHAVRATESGVALEVGRNFRALAEARALLDVQEAHREVALERHRVAVARRQEQANLVRDVLDARAALADADARYQDALSGYWTARADFEKSIGEES